MYMNRSKNYPIVRGRGNVAFERDLGYRTESIGKLRAKTTFITTARHAKRPDLLSQDIYGKPDYWADLMRYNKLDDAWNDLKAGIAIFVPSLADLEGFNENARREARKVSL